MSELVLYDKAECPFCWRVRLALHAQPRPVRLIRHDSPEGLAACARLSEFGRVPILVDGDLVLTESTVILHHLAQAVPGLLPQEPAQRAAVTERAHFIDKVAGRALREVIFEKRGKPEAEWDLRRIAAGLRGWYEALETVEDWLGEDGRLGADTGLDALALTTRVGLSHGYGAPLPPRLPRLRAWFERRRAAPDFLATAPAVVRAASDAPAMQ